MYPTNLFGKNASMTTLSSAFANTIVGYNCVLSGSNEYYGLLANNANLNTVSATFANLYYFGRDISNLGEWERIFDTNTNLSDLSGCFAQNTTNYPIPLNSLDSKSGFTDTSYYMLYITNNNGTSTSYVPSLPNIYKSYI